MSGNGEKVREVALAICKSRTCEGASCCQWPANMGRVNCNAKSGAYDEAAIAAIEAMRIPTEAMLEEGPLEPYMDAWTWGKMIDAALSEEG